MATDLTALLPTGDQNRDKRLNEVIEDVIASLNPDWWTSDHSISPMKVSDQEQKCRRPTRIDRGLRYTRAGRSPRYD